MSYAELAIYLPAARDIESPDRKSLTRHLAAQNAPGSLHPRAPNSRPHVPPRAVDELREYVDLELWYTQSWTASGGRSTPAPTRNKTHGTCLTGCSLRRNTSSYIGMLSSLRLECIFRGVTSRIPAIIAELSTMILHVSLDDLQHFIRTLDEEKRAGHSRP